MTKSQMTYPEIALALTTAKSLDKLCDLEPNPPLSECLRRLGCSPEKTDVQTQQYQVTHLHFGNEFCERLIPTLKELMRAQSKAKQLKLEFSLVTPMLTDSGFRLLERLLPQLDAGTEVVVNDWGTLERLRLNFPMLNPVLGRLLNKAIKDPRLPSGQWAKLHIFDNQSKHFQDFLARFSIDRLEMDVPPFATVMQFKSDPMKLSVHLPYGYTFKGRMCRIGSSGLKDDAKFAAAHACHKECLTYWVQTTRPHANAETELYSFQRGNTQFYEHSDSMKTAIWQAVQNNWISKLVFAGDWHENNHPA
ncbi:MAG: hypothetical protein K9G26_04985 [Emcibacter sp.]|nr:hypothetical protein [Emcibacter sp.]